MEITMGLRLTQMAEDGAAPLKLSHGRILTRAMCRYAMERTKNSVSVWFWDRNGASVLDEVANGLGSIDTDNWVRSLFIFAGMAY
jgi:hypothetical protein